MESRAWNRLNREYFNSGVRLKLPGVIYDAPTVYLRISYDSPSRAGPERQAHPNRFISSKENRY